MFKAFKPTSWNLVKNDYGMGDSNLEDVLPLSNEEPSSSLFDEVPNCDTFMDFVNPQPSSSNNKRSYSDRDEIITDKASLKKIIKEAIAECPAESFIAKAKECFKCVICFETTANRLAFCDRCGRFLGCISCIDKLSKCPICREDFIFPMRAATIPGLPDILNSSSEAQIPNANTARLPHSDTESDDPPPVLNTNID